MDQLETKKILAVLKAAYPNFYRGMNRPELEGIVSLWASMFETDPYPVVAAAVRALIATDSKGYPQGIGAVKEQIRRLTQPEQMTELEAWDRISRALRNGTYGAQEEFDRLPPVLQRCVGSASRLREWAMLDTEEVQTVISSNFMRSYRAVAQQEQEWQKLPEGIREQMRRISAQVFQALPEKGEA